MVVMGKHFSELYIVIKRVFKTLAHEAELIE